MSIYQPALDSYQHGMDQSIAGMFKLASQPTPAQTFMDALKGREQMDWQRGLQQQAQDRAWQETQRKAGHEDLLWNKFKTEEERKQTESDAKIKDWTVRRDQRGQRIQDMKSTAEATQELKALQFEEEQYKNNMNVMIQLGKMDQVEKYQTRLLDIQQQKNDIQGKATSGDLEFDEPTTDYWAQAVSRGGMGVLQGMRGKNADANKIRIMARVAQMGGAGVGPSPQQFLGNAAQYKADTGSVGQLQRQYDAVSAYEGMANRNWDALVKLSDGIPDTGSPMLNGPIRSAKKGAFGDPAVNNWEAQRQTTLTETARVVNNPDLKGILSDSARHEIEALLSSGATKEQIQQARDLFMAEMGRRKQELQRQLGEIGSRTGASSATQQVWKGAPPSNPGTHAGQTATNNKTGTVWTWNGKAWE